MKTKHWTYTILMGLILISTISCKKEKEIKITGFVKEYGTNNPIENAKVVLYYPGHLFNGMPMGGGLASTENTNASGFFNIDLNTNYKKEDLSVMVSKNGYSSITVNTNDDLNNLLLIPFATLKIHITNINPLNTDNSFYVYARDEYEYDSQYGMNFMSDMCYINTDTTLFEQIHGNMFPNKIEWTRGPSVSWIKQDTLVYCPGRDTVSISINY